MWYSENMKFEIERKFLLKDGSWRNPDISGVVYKQAYLMSNPDRSVRVRIAGSKGYITIKGKLQSGGMTRPEYEYEIPREDADNLMSLCEEGVVEKTRYEISYQDHVWEVDEFFGLNEGLITAEVELQSEDEEVVLPDWIGQEVTDDPRYKNGRLAKEPFGTWK